MLYTSQAQSCHRAFAYALLPPRIHFTLLFASLTPTRSEFNSFPQESLPGSYSGKEPRERLSWHHYVRTLAPPPTVTIYPPSQILSSTKMGRQPSCERLYLQHHTLHLAHYRVSTYLLNERMAHSPLCSRRQCGRLGAELPGR